MSFVVANGICLTVLGQDEDTPKGGVLYTCFPKTAATVFLRRWEAREAIRRTLTYAKMKGFNWGRYEDFVIWRIQKETYREDSEQDRLDLGDCDESDSPEW